MKNLGAHLIMLIAASLLMACEPKHDERLLDSEYIRSAANKLLQSPDDITYSEVKNLVLDNSCIKCHGDQKKEGGVDLSTHEGLMGVGSAKKVVYPFEPQRSDLFNVLLAKGKRMMPPQGDSALLEEQKALIYTWINRGAKQARDSSAQRPPSLQEELQAYFEHPETIDYSTVQNKVFQNKCFRCHSSESPDAEPDVLEYSADLTNYKSIFSPFNEVIVIGNPKESQIYRSIAIEQTMPSAKEGFQPLDSLLVKLVRLWILNCAIERFDPEAGEEYLSDPDTPDKRRLCDGQ